MGNWRARLDELGIQLPEVAAPVAAYIPALHVGNQIWTSGQLPFVQGELPATGKVAVSPAAGEVSADQAKELAGTAVLNVLAAIDSVAGLDSITRVLKVVGYVASAEGFTAQPGVINGASELIGEIFGSAGQHVRAAVGVAELPLGSPVEIELVVEVG